VYKNVNFLLEMLQKIDGLRTGGNRFKYSWFFGRTCSARCQYQLHNVGMFHINIQCWTWISLLSYL